MKNQIVRPVSQVESGSMSQWFLRENHFMSSLMEESITNVQMLMISKHSDKCTFYTLRFDCSFAAANTIKPQLL